MSNYDSKNSGRIMIFVICILSLSFLVAGAISRELTSFDAFALAVIAGILAGIYEELKSFNKKNQEKNQN